MLMKIQCPFNPKHIVDFADSYCQECERRLTPKELIQFYLHRVRFRGQLKLLTECPTCEFVFPLPESKCPRCGLAFTLGAARSDALKRFGWCWRDFATHASVGQLRSFQRYFLLCSLLILFAAISCVSLFKSEEWSTLVFLSVIYLTVSGLMIKWFVPPHVLLLIAQRTSRRVKLAMVVNYLTILLAIQVCIGSWVAQATIVASLFGVTAISAWLLCRIAWPMSLETYRLFFESVDTFFDPMKPQGRQAKSD
jgi:hypothetical protein